MHFWVSCFSFCRKFKGVENGRLVWEAYMMVCCSSSADNCKGDVLANIANSEKVDVDVEKVIIGIRSLSRRFIPCTESLFQMICMKHCTGSTLERLEAQQVWIRLDALPNETFAEKERGKCWNDLVIMYQFHLAPGLEGAWSMLRGGEGW